MPLSEDEAKRDILARVGRIVAERLQGSSRDLAQRFIPALFRDVAPEDLLSRDPQDLYGAALALLRFAGERQPGSALVRVVNPDLERQGWQSTHTVVQITNDDMPFLVDSVCMELTRHGLGIHLVVHPVVVVSRDASGRLLDIGGQGASAESLMHIEIDRLSDPVRIAQLEADLVRVLGDVRRAVADWRSMVARVAEAITELEPVAAVIGVDELAETKAFLEWIADDHFTFLGVASYDLAIEDGRTRLRRRPGSALGILRDDGSGPAVSRSFDALPESIRARSREPLPPLVVTKANTRSTVHRPSYLDYVGVKRYGDGGSVIGEHRFLGLFTSVAYSLPPAQIPLLRRRVAEVMQRAGLPARGHSAKALANILNTFPRDELLQSDTEQLYRTSRAILQLQDRPKIRLFVRTDAFQRFVSCLVYVPRERYNTTLRERFQTILRTALNGTDTDFQALVSESPLARLHFIVRTPDGPPPDLDVAALEAKLVEAGRAWQERLREGLLDAYGEEEGNRLFRLYGRGLPAAYEEQVSARTAVFDLAHIDRIAREGGLSMGLSRRLEDEERLLRFKLIQADKSVLLADVLPILDNMGLRVLGEDQHRLRDAGGREFWIHDYQTEAGAVPKLAIDELSAPFQSLFAEVWRGAMESDGFNRLCLSAGLDAAGILVLRAYCRYMLQVGAPFSQSYIEQTLNNNPGIAADLVGLFNALFDPAGAATSSDRVMALETSIKSGLENVAVLDEDRIIRRYLGMIQATLRTNAFQRDAAGARKPYLSLKFDSRKVPAMPAPAPLYEVFVYAPDVEAIHLRGGKVARGGIRWSDRREDFRTEILGLMKAQMVKNSVIVPVGAKGGFVVKRPPAGTDRGAMQQEAIRCYRMFLSGLLDITDNRVGGSIAPPRDVVRYDDDDPYLVVAADKGTATFSDIANAVSRDYGFWLDDAFASGGSAGYDHKKMGITARGAWESVRRHFRELGKDPAVDSLTVVGIGDMSGDVFGNGMLLSDKLRLIAAFDHRHVFIDPSPDPAVSFAERRRLFELPRSSWDDYDRRLISAGGGVFARSLKSVAVSAEAAAALGITPGDLTPQDLVAAILRAPVDLFWNGGIGTFVKATAETHRDAQDRSNDGIRADGRELRCKVVGEGGNLGFTQRGRVEFAMAGGRINTDFIDNSAGVDCSDHEVNIKILLGDIVAAGDLTLKQRDQLLAEMTDEVGELVLRDNILQNIALSVAERRGVQRLDAQIGLMRRLETEGRLVRSLEQLPSDLELAERRKQGRGLTRPEIAVLLAYAKLSLFQELLDSDVPDDPHFADDLLKYFPRPLRRRFPDQIARHRLRREIIATWTANSMINRGLETFVADLAGETGASAAEIARAYVVSRDALDLLPLWGIAEALPRGDAQDPQPALLDDLARVTQEATRWFLMRPSRPIDLPGLVARYRPAIATVVAHLPEILPEAWRDRYAAAVGAWRNAGLDDAMAQRVAALPLMVPTCEITATASRTGTDVVDAARAWFAVSIAVEADRIAEDIAQVPARGPWDHLALASLRDDLAIQLTRLGAEAIALGGATRWLDARKDELARFRRVIDEIHSGERPDLAALTVAVRSLGRLGMAA